MVAERCQDLTGVMQNVLMLTVLQSYNTGDITLPPEFTLGWEDRMSQELFFHKSYMQNAHVKHLPHSSDSTNSPTCPAPSTLDL